MGPWGARAAAAAPTVADLVSCALCGQPLDDDNCPDICPCATDAEEIAAEHRAETVLMGPWGSRSTPAPPTVVTAEAEAADPDAEEIAARIARADCPVCLGRGAYFSEEAGDYGGEIVSCITCR